MIQFFRKIRQSSLSDNKFTKYLLYAFGEILLVVIGILIALQIDNWNEQQKNRESEHLYYCRMLEDFDLDKQLIGELVAEANHRIAVSKEILLELDSGTKDRNYLLNKFLVTIRSDNYVPPNMTYKDLISSGNLKLIQDIKIKNSLIQYYSALESKKFQLERNRNEQIQETFQLINSSIEFGLHEFEYINKLAGPEVIETLPIDDWTKDENNDSYKNFQKLLLFNIAMSGREIQQFEAINRLMQPPYQLLQEKCENE